MGIRIKLTPEEETRLRAVANSRGIGIEDMARHLISRQLPPTGSKDPTLTLLEEWDREDATEDAREIAARQREWHEFREGTGSSGLALREPRP